MWQNVAKITYRGIRLIEGKISIQQLKKLQKNNRYLHLDNFFSIIFENPFFSHHSSLYSIFNISFFLTKPAPDAQRRVVTAFLEVWDTTD